MIWGFILLALILSYLPLINKKIELSNLMWLLLPIDAYGISVAGAVIKPYMILALLLPIVLYCKNKGTDFELVATKSQLFAGIITILILIQSILITDNLSAVKSSFLAIFVYMCAQFYVSCTDTSKTEQLSDVFIASCFGCSAVFLIAYICLQNGIFIDAVVAQNRTEDGIFMLLSNMSDGNLIKVYRLRGFAFDPNTMFPQFIFGISACVYRLFKKFNLYYIITIVMSVICILLSSSRMGLLCCIISITIAVIASINNLRSVKSKIIGTVSSLVLCAGLLMISMSQKGQQFISSLLSTYSNRASLTDEYGRFSIWKECLSVCWSKNPLLGVGLGRMDEFTITERMTHNTWLQFICECGFVIGSVAIIYFLGVMILGWAKIRPHHLQHPDNTSYLALVIGYTMTIVSLISVDNITCSYLWFSALIILKITSSTKQENNSLREQTPR